MNENQFTAIVRNLLLPVAGVAAAHGVAAGTWDGIVGFIAALGLLGWGVVQHDTTQDMLLSVVRSGIGALGGYFVQRGWATSDQVTLDVSLGALIVPNVWTWFVHADPGATSGAVKRFAIVAVGVVCSKWLLVGMMALGLAACNSLTPAQEQALVTAAINAGVVGCQAAFPKDAAKVKTCQDAVTVGAPLAQAIAQAVAPPTVAAK